MAVTGPESGPSSGPSSGRFRFRLWDRRVLTHYPNYLFQCGLVTASLVVILLVEDVVLRAAIVVAVASTAFTIFIVPNSVAASPRRVIGGHVVAVVSGGAFSLVLLGLGPFPVEGSRLIPDIMAALSVGLGMLIMVATDTEHPPAAGTALGLVIHGWTWSAVLFILSSALILSLIRLALRPKLTNLI